MEWSNNSDGGDNKHRILVGNRLEKPVGRTGSDIG